MDQVKEHNGHYVEITGLVLKSSITSATPGTRIGNTRVVIGAPPPSSDPVGMSMRSPSGGLPVMDASALRYIDASVRSRRIGSGVQGFGGSGGASEPLHL